ncbi:double-strand break repair protein AddB [Parvularcula sp. LCG005]|uniref:double-strand break repair protein AddB n=1 Tax=Parvularcula sp. LCG005 TaxID=3078805 RepID=UPI002942A489|nr:double-strand break repair protein AddB [Parvularcula sp. LCG005]WOI53499.1 double-strand break repair protein AddB [Parvularcula sp. LCG005]
MTGSALDFLTAPTPALYTIPAGRPFLADLAAPILTAYADQPDAIADLTIFLPNRRAVRRLADVFFEKSIAAGRGAVILPRLRALGDVTEEDLLFSGMPPAEASDLLPAADLTDRRLILARTIRQTNQQADWPACLTAADDLAGLLDSFHLEDVPLSALHDLNHPEHVQNAAAHWEKSLEFLSIISRFWPALTEEQGWMEPAERQRVLMEALTENLVAHESGHPIIVAGSLGTVRATGKLMAAVAKMPSGCVVFPGLDLEMDERAWSLIDPPHPQALFRERLDRDFGFDDRAAVHPWPGMDDDLSAKARRSFLSLALRPAAATDDWYQRFTEFNANGAMAEACRGLSLAVAQTEDEEAGFVSLLIREALEQPDRTVMLVTPDRQLARRVTSKLRAWSIDVDDTGGVPAGGTYRGTFLRLVAAWLDDPACPVKLTAMLAHELASFGRDRADVQAINQKLDRRLRGRRQAPDLAALQAIVAAKDDPPTDVLALLDELIDHCRTFSEQTDTAGRLSTHVRIAERAASLPDEPGEQRLWRYEDGEHLARHLGALLQSSFLPEGGVNGSYHELFEALLGSGVVRKRGGHPRLAIYGLMEARLQTADTIIVSGLNEGVWPDAAPTDSFLSRPMRQRLGLPSPEQKIGRAAHDFAQAAASPHVILTRSARRGRDPATPSRWLVRLESFLDKADMRKALDQSARLRTLLAARQMATEVVPRSAPEPKPPVSARPVELSISDIETMLRDPYSIYAKHILGLRAWDRLDDPIGAKHKGTAFHNVMQRIGEMPAGELPTDLRTYARALVREEFSSGYYPDELQILWGEDIANFCQFVHLYEEQGRQYGDPVLIEAEGKWSFHLDDGSAFHIRGRVDRVDAFDGGKVSIVDFKSSEKRPTIDQMATFSPQLSVTALMLAAGAFEKAGPQVAGQIAFLNMFSARSDDEPLFNGKHTVGSDEIDVHVTDADRRLREHLAFYRDLDQAYLSQPRSFFTNAYGDYDHLARRGEWAGQGSDDD